MRKGRASLIEDIKVAWSLHLEDKQTMWKRSGKCFQGKEKELIFTDARVDLKEMSECVDKMGGFATGTGGLVLARTKSSPVRDVLRIRTPESRLLWRLYSFISLHFFNISQTERVSPRYYFKGQRLMWGRCCSTGISTYHTPCPCLSCTLVALEDERLASSK